MPSPIIAEQTERLNALLLSIEAHAPQSQLGSASFRADLAGLLSVMIVASYETAIKETMISFAGTHSAAFSGFVERNFSRLNSKVRISDLHRYAQDLDPVLAMRFKEKVGRRRSLFLAISGKNFETSLNQLLNWRHEYAHAGTRVTTIEELVSTHRLARIPIQTFEEVFSEH